MQFLSVIPRRLRFSYGFLLFQSALTFTLYLAGWVDLSLLLLSLFSAGVIACGIADAKTRLIPDPILLFCALSAVSFHWEKGGFQAVLDQGVFALAFSGGLFGLVVLASLWSRAQGARDHIPVIMGAGDLKLLAVSCLMLSPADVFAMIVLTAMSIWFFRWLQPKRMARHITLAAYLAPSLVLMVIQIRLSL